MKTRTVRSNSVRNTKRKELERRSGPAVNDRKKWSNREKYRLLVCWLGNMKFKPSEGVCLYHLFGRPSEESLRRKIWGIAVNYCNPKKGTQVDKFYYSYQQGFRKGMQWNEREERVLLACIHRFHRPDPFSWQRTAHILGREIIEIQNKVFRLAGHQPGVENLLGNTLHLTEVEILDRASSSLENRYGKLRGPNKE